MSGENNLHNTSSVSRWDGETHENMYEKFDMAVTAKGEDCGVVELVRHSTLDMVWISGQGMRIILRRMCMTPRLWVGVLGKITNE